jgi:hypothetical protein
MASDLIPLDTLAAEINVRFKKAIAIEAKAKEHRIAAGLQLIEARKRVERGEAGIGWERWCAENIERSQRDIRKVMRLAGAPDPTVSLAAERAATQARMTTLRERAHVRPVSPAEPVETTDPEQDRVAAAMASGRQARGVKWKGPRQATRDDEERMHQFDEWRRSELMTMIENDVMAGIRMLWHCLSSHQKAQLRREFAAE